MKARPPPLGRRLRVALPRRRGPLRRPRPRGGPRPLRRGRVRCGGGGGKRGNELHHEDQASNFPQKSLKNRQAFIFLSPVARFKMCMREFGE